MQNLSSSLEDYLECIYNKIKSYGSVKAIDLSKELNVSRASVTEALNKLAQKSYINYGRYGIISITSLGIKKAEEITNKHSALQAFFEDVLGIDKNEASDIACKVEHVITKNILDRITTFTDFCIREKDFLKKFKER